MARIAKEPLTLRDRIIEALDHFNDLDYYNNYTHEVSQEMADVLQEALEVLYDHEEE